jgi:Zn-dependent peptidase ImmA (M78 family)/transcriptional regulator with XRE-family HTH domain
MTFDSVLFGNKLSRFCELFPTKATNLCQRTGISNERLSDLKIGKSQPSGDEILILADYFMCDYTYFISNIEDSIYDASVMFFRNYEGHLNPDINWNIQEFLYLCACEEHLKKELNIVTYDLNNFKSNIDELTINKPKQTAIQLLNYLDIKNFYELNDVFFHFRRLGFHIFRRNLKVNTISGLYFYHKEIGHCILINNDEDLFRQRFSVAHEVGHAIFDGNQYNLSKNNSTGENKGNMGQDQNSETRANAFAGAFIVPQQFLTLIPNSNIWDDEKIIEYSKKISVNPITLAIALNEANLISNTNKDLFKMLKIPQDEKFDVEFISFDSEKDKERLRLIQDKGLSNYYIKLCFEGFRNGIISQGRLAEMLLCDTQSELTGLCLIFNESLDHEL